MRTGSSWLHRLTVALCFAVVGTLLVNAAPAGAHHGGAHILKLYSLSCMAQNDPSGDDEPYLKLNGNRFWENPDCYPIHTYDLGGMEISFWSEADLYIMEDDLGSDDTVGYIRVGPQAGQGRITYYSYKTTPTGYIFNYRLDYEVL